MLKVKLPEAVSVKESVLLSNNTKLLLAGRPVTVPETVNVLVEQTTFTLVTLAERLLPVPVLLTTEHDCADGEGVTTETA